MSTHTTHKFTGERYIPNLDSPEISYEHWHRYLYATQFVKGKVVLDIACGEGYGSFLLSKYAEKMVGIDISQEVVKNAASTYVKDNLEFKACSAGNILINGQKLFDVIVSFETIEHLSEEDQKSFLKEVKRLLKPEGLFIVSTPNKLVYNDIPKYKNEFHIKEFYINEFEEFLGNYFKDLKLVGQRIYPVSYIWNPYSQKSRLTEYRLEYSEKGFRPSEDPKSILYSIAICSDRTLESPEASVLVDLSERILRLKDQRIANIEHAVREKEGHIGSLEESLKQKEEQIANLQNAVREKEAALAHIYNSHGWKGLLVYYKIRDKIFPNFRKFILVWKNEGLTIAIKKVKNKIFTIVRFNKLLYKLYKVKDERVLKQILKDASEKVKDIVIYSHTIDWNIPLFQRPQHMATQMARLGWLVFYCSGNGAYDNIHGIKEIEKNLYLSNRYDLITKYLSNCWVVVLAGSPSITIDDFKALKSKGHKIIYEYIDEISPLISGSENTVNLLYKRHKSLNRSLVDLILTSATPLYEEMLTRFPKEMVVFHPNAVDHDHFHIERNYNDCPQDLEEIILSQLPIIGYYGALASWIDYDLLNFLTECRSQWNFVMIGWNYDGSLKKLVKRKNLWYLGIKTYKDLPKYGIWFDVAIIPFKKGKIAQSTSPLKLYEYMAMNKPVVITSDLQECMRYEGVFVGKDKENFLEKVEYALKIKDDADYKQLLDKQAKDNTWEKRAIEMANHMKKIDTEYIKQKI